MTATAVTQTDKRSGSFSSAAALAPALLFVLIFQFIPLFTLFRYSLNIYSPTELMVEALTLENYIRFFNEPYFQNVLLTTLGISSFATLTCLVLGYPVAYMLARTKVKFKSLILILILFPLLVGNVVRAAGWMAVFGRQGAMNYILLQLGIISQPIEVLYTW